jgi:hypothetical protein
MPKSSILMRHSDKGSENLGFWDTNLGAFLTIFSSRSYPYQQNGKEVEKVVKRICSALDLVCQYRFCGPGWFPFDEPTPEKDGCGWWDQIRECAR